jgi:hypothetical protein
MELILVVVVLILRSPSGSLVRLSRSPGATMHDSPEEQSESVPVSFGSWRVGHL